MLELVTGREPNNGEENTSLAEWAWKHFAEGKPIMDALDKEIKMPSNLEDMSTVFKLGLICTSNSPSTRPSMKEALHILQRCSPSETFGGKKVRREFDVTPLLGSAAYLSSYKKSRKMSEEDGDSLVYSVWLSVWSDNHNQFPIQTNVNSRFLTRSSWFQVQSRKRKWKYKSIAQKLPSCRRTCQELWRENDTGFLQNFSYRYVYSRSTQHIYQGLSILFLTGALTAYIGK